MSSGSSDRPIHTPRGLSSTTLLETPIQSSLPSLSRSSCSVTQGDVTNFLHLLPFDRKSIAADYKFSRQVEFKRLTSIALGLQVDDLAPNILKGRPLPSPSKEDLKRLKVALRESSNNARERLNILDEAMFVMNKCFPSISSKKRSRLDALSSDRGSALQSSERSVLGTSMTKTGSQNHTVASGFELEQQKSEERVKIAVPNKRTRTSMADARSDSRVGTPARSSGSMDREVFSLPSTGAVHGEERSPLIGVDSWEKPRMKKKRSGIKPDMSPSSATRKPTNGFSGAKQGMQPRPTDMPPKLNDSLGFRSEVASGAVGVGKADGTLQPTTAGMRSSIPKAEQGNCSNLYDRRDRPDTVDKEIVNLKALNKKNAREDFSSPSPTSNTKINSAARAPRSGLNVLHKLSPVVQRTTVASDCELSQSTSKNSAAVGASIRKSTPAPQPSSPPVTQWASQRLHKNSRTARRTNFVPIIASNDESPFLDATPNGTQNETESVTARRLSTNFPKQVKSKGDHFSSPAVSESEESGATETKTREKIKKTNEVDEKASPNCQKVSALPSRKNKLVNEDDNGDGVRKKGRRTGRGSTSTRSLMPMTVEKLGSMGTAKQLRSAKLGFGKTERKVGRPPTRKLSDRKPCTNQKQTTTSATADFHDDGHEELLAAAAAVTDPAFCFSSPFWRQMELYFSFISDSDLAYLKQQEKSLLTTSATVSPNLNTCSTVPNGDWLLEASRDRNYLRSPDNLSSHLVLTSFETPLCQRLMAALISEEESEEFYSRNDGFEFDVHETGFELEKLQSNSMNHQLSGNFQLASCTGLNGYKVAANGPVNDLDHLSLDADILSENGLISDFKYLQNGLLLGQTMEAGISISEFQYCNMSIDEKILLELESVGLSIEPVPDLTQTGHEETSEEIGGLKDKYLGEVSTAKEAAVGKLFTSASEMRGFQEKEFEHRALDKLMAMAYEKYMACWGSNPTGGKNMSSKMAKQAALAFVKRTLEHCQRFEETNKSCFGEAFFRDIFISGSARLKDEVRVSVATGTQQRPVVNDQDIYCPNPTLSLDNVGTMGTCSVPSGFGASLSSSAKGKRSERDREGKGSREALSRNGTHVIGKTTSVNIKGERKTKLKPKQKSTQLSASVNSLVNTLPEQPKTIMHLHPASSGIMKSESAKEDDELLEDPIDLSHLQLPGMDDFGGSDDLDGQGQDFGSWLNIDDELPDHDGFDGFNGLEIPMDDLSELNMKF